MKLLNSWQRQPKFCAPVDTDSQICRAALDPRCVLRVPKGKTDWSDAITRKPQVYFDVPPDNSDAPFVPPFRPDVIPHGPGVSHPMDSEISAALLHAQSMPVADPEMFTELGEENRAEWVDTLGSLQSMSAELEDEQAIAVDLEHHWQRSFLGFTCLLQISTRDRDWLVDAIALRSHIHHVLTDIFEDPNIVKVFHSASSDTRWLEKDFGIYVVNMFDSSIAAEKIHKSFTLHSLLGLYCDVHGTRAEKKLLQNADWRVRPLPNELSKYAQTDTHYLLYIYDRLRVELQNTGILNKVLEESAEASRGRFTKLVNNLHEHERKGYAAGLDNRQIHLLLALCKWRVEQARLHDEGLAYIVTSRRMLELSRQNPKGKDEVRVALGIAEDRPLPEFLENNVEGMIAVLKGPSDEEMDKDWEDKINLRRNAKFEREVRSFIDS